METMKTLILVTLLCATYTLGSPIDINAEAGNETSTITSANMTSMAPSGATMDPATVSSMAPTNDTTQSTLQPADMSTANSAEPLSNTTVPENGSSIEPATMPSVMPTNSSVTIGPSDDNSTTQAVPQTTETSTQPNPSSHTTKAPAATTTKKPSKFSGASFGGGIALGVVIAFLIGLVVYCLRKRSGSAGYARYT